MDFAITTPSVGAHLALKATSPLVVLFKFLSRQQARREPWLRTAHLHASIICQAVPLSSIFEHDAREQRRETVGQ